MFPICRPRFSFQNMCSRLNQVRLVTSQRTSSSSILQSRILSKCLKPAMQTPTRSFWDNFPCWTRGFYHSKDKLDPKEYTLVYRTTSFNFYFYGHCIAAFTLLSEALYGTVFLYYYFIFNTPLPVPESVSVFRIDYNWLSFVILTYFTLQSASLIYLTQVTPLRMYYNSKSNRYVVVFFTLNPFVTRNEICFPGDMKLTASSLLNTIRGDLLLHNRRVYISTENFRSLEHYNRLLGNIS